MLKFKNNFTIIASDFPVRILNAFFFEYFIKIHKYKEIMRRLKQ